MKDCKRFIGCVLIALLALLGPTAPDASAQNIKVPEKATPIMDVDEVRVGMKGYGMTVFHGTVIEPFSVEVLSIEPNKRPKYSVIWVRSKDDRMVESGPVKGMSGSPIYLWDEGEEQVLGKGGRLIGAFAFGYPETLRCIIGVQPIAYMRETTSRVSEDPLARLKPGGGSVSSTALIRTLDQVESITPTDRSAAMARLRIDQLRGWLSHVNGDDPAQADARRDVPYARTPGSDTRALPMMMPITMGSPEAVGLFAPLYESLGLIPVAGPSGAVGGEPPHDVDVDSTMLEPGSVIAIPLAYGDMDLGATGTVTDVLPTGEVLALGHQMSGEGDMALPMATGYVHFVVPRRGISFKSAGTLVPQGTIVRDEMAGTVGVAGKGYDTAPVDVTVRVPGHDARDYHYEVATHPAYGPRSTSNVVFLSIMALHAPPIENTFHLKADLAFTGGRTFKIDSLIAGGSARNVVPEMVPVISAMTENPFENQILESAVVDITFTEGIRLASVVSAQLDHAEVEPGDVVSIDVELNHYAGEIEHRRIMFKVPEQLDDGEYPLTISGAVEHASIVMMANPGRMIANDMDDLAELLQESLDYRMDAVYATLQLPDAGLAMGRNEMPKLPSSRSAILQSPTRPQAVRYTPLVKQVYETDAVVHGEVAFILRVKKR